MILKSVRAVIFDLDGTIYCGNTLLEGAVELLGQLHRQKINVFFCTNNSTKTRLDICAKMNSLNISASPEKVYSAAYAAARYIKHNNYSKVYCFGASGLYNELKASNISTVSDPSEASVVVIGLDTNVDYDRLSRLLPLREKPCYLIACNNDKFFPSDICKIQLGCGFIVSLVEEVLERNVDYNVGKPNTYMLDMLIEEHGLAMDEIVMVGDSLESDIAMAQAAGCRSVYLSSQQDASGVFQVKSLHELRALFI